MVSLATSNGIDLSRWRPDLMESGCRVAAHPRFEPISLASSSVLGYVVGSVVMVESIRCVADIGNRSCFADDVEGLDRIDTVLEKDPVRHCWATVDPHVAVD